MVIVVITILLGVILIVHLELLGSTLTALGSFVAKSVNHAEITKGLEILGSNEEFRRV